MWVFEMALFRKRPVIVEAVQWFPGEHCLGVNEIVYDATKSAYYGYVVTIHGEPAKVAPGDWVITEPDGEHYYPCKPDVFAATYEQIDEDKANGPS
jgi:hypothetical protein